MNGRIKGKIYKAVVRPAMFYGQKLGHQNVAGRENKCGQIKNAAMVLLGEKGRRDMKRQN